MAYANTSSYVENSGGVLLTSKIFSRFHLPIHEYTEQYIEIYRVFVHRNNLWTNRFISHISWYFIWSNCFFFSQPPVLNAYSTHPYATRGFASHLYIPAVEMFGVKPAISRNLTKLFRSFDNIKHIHSGVLRNIEIRYLFIWKALPDLRNEVTFVTYFHCFGAPCPYECYE